jgi:hypothetical protein
MRERCEPAAWARQRLRTVPAWVLIILALACTDRERANPLDPRNPETHGVPPPPRVVPGASAAVLAWQPILVRDVGGYRIERSSAGEPFSPVGPGDLPSWQRSVRDSPLTQGTSYRYRLVVVAGDREVFSDSVIIRTAAGSAWFAGETTLQLVSSRLGTGLDTVATLSWPTAIDASSDESAWVADYGASSLLLVNPAPSVEASIPLDGYVVGLASTQGGSRCWAVEAWYAELLQIAPHAVLRRITLPDRPYCVAWSPSDETVWVGHESGVTRYSPEGVADTTYTEPVRSARISVSPWDGSCWTVQPENGSVIRLPASQGQPTVRYGFGVPCDVCARTADGHCWVADCGSDSLYLLSSEGTTVAAWPVPGIAGVSTTRGMQSAWVSTEDGLLRFGRDGFQECALSDLRWGAVAACLP